jgi:hypothetical protein
MFKLSVFFVREVKSFILQYKINLSSLWCTVVSGRLGVSFLATVVGVYSRLLYIPGRYLRSIPSAGSVDLPFGCYLISLGRCFSNHLCITSPGFLPRKRMFQSCVCAIAPRLICTIFTTTLIYLYLLVILHSFLYITISFKFLSHFPTKANLFYGLPRLERLSRIVCVCFRLDLKQCINCFRSHPLYLGHMIHVSRVM